MGMAATRYNEELRFVPASRFLLPEFLLRRNSNNVDNNGITDNFQTSYGKTSDFTTDNFEANHSKTSNSIAYKNSNKVTVEHCGKLCVSSKN
jgi:hypothetical protein